jgi:arsenate reductase
MAEALLRKQAGENVDVYSAGTQPKGIHPLTHVVLREAGIDTSALRSKHVSEVMGRVRPDWVIVVCASAQETCPRELVDAPHRLFWPFDDPPAFQGAEDERLQEFRRVRDEIDRQIQNWLSEVEHLRQNRGGGDR